MPTALPSRLIVSAVCLLVLAVFVILYMENGDLYRQLLTMLMLRPFPHPFIDWEFVTSATKCWSQGVNVYVDNTCFETLPHLKFAYSPLWLRATFLSPDQGWVGPLGLAFAVLFFLSLAWLPPPRRGLDLALTLLAATSSLTAFALERGNVDVIIFILAVIGVNLWIGRPRLRLAGYAVFAFMGLLKYYPFVLLMLALGERMKVLVPICLAFTATLLAFVWTFHRELLAAKDAIPTGSPFTDLFGAVNLPSGLTMIVLRAAPRFGVQNEWLLKLVSDYLPAALLTLLVLEAVLRAAWLARRCGVQNGIADLPGRDVGFLLAGAALICGCFFTGQSVGYRGIFLLLAVPGLLRLSQTLPGQGGRAMLLGTCAAIVFVMWVLSIQFWIAALGFSATSASDQSVLGLVHWVLHEAAWWWIAGVLLSALFGFVMNSPIGRAVASINPHARRRLQTGRLSR